MDKPSIALTKTCGRCGLIKPLAAFLQVSGPQGTEYGSICSTCRKLTPEDLTPNEIDDGTKSSTGARIDAKTKIHSDIDKQKQHDDIEELYHKERDEVEEENIVQEEKTQEVQKEEKVRRENFLYKHSFATQDSVSKKWPTAESKIAEATQQGVKQTYEEQQAAIQKTGITEKSKMAEINTAAPIDDMRSGIQLKYGESFKQFTSWLGKSTPITQAVNQTAADIKNKDAKKDETLAEHIKSTWGPKGKK